MGRAALRQAENANKNNSSVEKLNKLKESGIDPTVLAMNISIICFLSDMIEGRVSYMAEMLNKTGNFALQKDLHAKEINRHSKFMRKEATRNFTSKQFDLLADSSDFLNDLIELCRNADEDEQLKIVSSIKMIIKSKKI